MSQPVPQPSWKEEVNRRLEAHKSRKGLSVVAPAKEEEHGSVNSRAAAAAARVAARFAHAPSYGEMQTAEARAALCAAEAATRAALEAQAAAQAALDHFETAQADAIEQEDLFASATPEPEHGMPAEPAAVAGPAEPPAPAGPVTVRWDHELPPAPWSEPHAGFDEPAPGPAEAAAAIEQVDGAQTIQANLIQFPRELVATRRMRPRLAEAPAASADTYGQLSIFEVDPHSISIEASVADAVTPAPSWSGPELAGMDLAEHEDLKDDEHEPARTAPDVDLAPLEQRLMAAAIDGALIVGLLCAGAAGMASHLDHALAPHSAEVLAAAGFVLIGVLYYAFFLMTAASTPGMMYAGIGLCTFDDEHPTRAQLRDRLGAMLVSLVPVGLGMAWSIFDEDHLSWHDRLSRTYLRRR